MILLQNVTKYYQMGEILVKALENINLSINKGEVVVVLGPSGCGKTTLLNIIGALDRVTSGTIIVNNQEINNLNRQKQFTFRRNSIAFIFQTFNLFPTLSALENVQYVASLSKIGQSKKMAIKALEDVGLEKRIRHFPHQLSGGEQQRVAIARALVKNAPVILADEPTGELDFYTGRHILQLLVEQQDEKEKTVLLVTHNREISRIANRVIKLHSGLISSDSRPDGGPVPVNDLTW
ncbi:MAG: ABC transporter ATP-binding protein [Candidatus Hodarchaeales archaeon]|jgi:putative ABC transport system ATP-binding protein